MNFYLIQLNFELKFVHASHRGYLKIINLTWTRLFFSLTKSIQRDLGEIKRLLKESFLKRTVHDMALSIPSRGRNTRHKLFPSSFNRRPDFSNHSFVSIQLGRSKIQTLVLRLAYQLFVIRRNNELIRELA